MSIKTKLVVMVMVIMALVAGTIIFFTERDVEKAMFESERRSAGNVLDLVELNVRGRYKNLLQDRLAAIGALKQQLSNMSEIVTSGMDEFHAMAKAGRLSEKQAKARALEWISRLRYDEHSYFFVFDANGMARAYPDASLLGRSLSAFSDVKGRVVVEAMYEDAKRYGSAVATYHWKRLGSDDFIKRFGMFTYYEPWDLVVAATMDVEGLEEKEQAKLGKIVEVLRETAPRIKVAQSGYVFIFDGTGRPLVHPQLESTDFAALENGLSHRPLVEDLVEAAGRDENRTVLYRPAFASGRGRVQEINVTYFKTLDWYIAVAAYVDEIQAPAKSLVAQQTGIILLIALFSLVLALTMVGRISRPLAVLDDHARTLPEQDFTAPPAPKAELNDLAEHHRDEVGRLAESFLFMETALRENIRNLIETTRAKQRIEGELSVAHDIQMGLLPKIFPPFPDRQDMDLHGLLHPAKEVGGDLFDFFLLDDHRVLFTVGDVSDKGVPASLFMAITISLIKAAAQQGLSPEQIMSSVNNAVAVDNPKGMFVTLYIGVLDLKTGHVWFANGGHNPTVHMTAQGTSFVKGLSGPMVGAMEDMDYQLLEMDLNPGEALFVYSDGVTEAMNEAKDLYSDERLLELLDTLRGAGSKAVVDKVMEDVKAHVAGAPPSDDITMLCLRWQGPKA